MVRTADAVYKRAAMPSRLLLKALAGPRFALPLLIVGGIVISFSGIFVKLSEVGPSATPFRHCWFRACMLQYCEHAYLNKRPLSSKFVRVVVMASLSS